MNKFSDSFHDAGYELDTWLTRYEHSLSLLMPYKTHSITTHEGYYQVLSEPGGEAAGGEVREGFADGVLGLSANLGKHTNRN